MNSEQFVNSLKKEKEILLSDFFNNPNSAVFQYIQAIELSSEQEVKVRQAFSLALSDSFYTLLLGLAGEASLGGVQENYEIACQKNKLDTDEIAEFAWECFQKND